MSYGSSKMFGPFSAAFRQHGVKSHCNQIHGYGLTIRVDFEADELDNRNWVVDFGGLKALKQLYEEAFDHKLVVALNDPDLDLFKLMEARGVATLNIIPAAGCEVFAKYAWALAQDWLITAGQSERVHITCVEVFEHSSNSAWYIPDK